MNSILWEKWNGSNFFGALTGKEAKAEEAFAEQTEILEEVEKRGKNREDHSIFLCHFQRTDPGTAEHGLYSEADRTGRGKVYF